MPHNLVNMDIQRNPEFVVDSSLNVEDVPKQLACNFVKTSVAMVLSVPVDHLNAQTRRTANVAFARQVAMYITHVTLGMSLGAVGRVFGRDRTTVAHACRLIEDRRDEPLVDFLVDCLERSVGEWLVLSENKNRPCKIDA